jgi:CBS domain-containing protein
MNESYKRLPTTPLPGGTPVFRFERLLAGTVTLDSPALEVMTDFRQLRAVTISPESSLDVALSRMVCAGVRLLFVVDRTDAVLGVVTSRDLSGERPVEFASRERVPRGGIRIADIMTPRHHVEVLCMADVLRARVGDVVETLRTAGRQHAVVMEMAEGDSPSSQSVIRGLFSITRIGRQLGVEIQPTGRVQSFADLEKVMNVSGGAAM